MDPTIKSLITVALSVYIVSTVIDIYRFFEYLKDRKHSRSVFDGLLNPLKGSLTEIKLPKKDVN